MEKLNNGKGAYGRLVRYILNDPDALEEGRLIQLPTYKFGNNFRDITDFLNFDLITMPELTVDEIQFVGRVARAIQYYRATN